MIFALRGLACSSNSIPQAMYQFLYPLATEIKLEDLVIKLILQDLKHNQLIYGLDKLKMDAGYFHFLGILDLVQRLMDVPEERMDEFGETYMDAMHRSLEFPISRSEEELRGLVVECY